MNAMRLWAASGLVFLITATANAQDYEPALTPWGTPSIEGMWDFRTLTPLERPPQLADKAVLTPKEAEAFLEQTLAGLDVDNRTGESKVDIEGAYNRFWWDWGSELNEDLRTSLIVDPPNGRLPEVTPAAKEQMLEHNMHRTPPVRDLFSYSADPSKFLPAGPEAVGLSERCIVGFNAGPPVTPSAYNNNLRIIQTPTSILLVTEMIHDARVVQMDNRPLPPEHVQQWHGESRGYWEGNTLVVKTSNFSDKRATFQIPNSFEDLTSGGAAGSADNMALTERFTPTSEGQLLYEYTIEDEATFAQPFTVMIPMRATDERMFEYACHEGNYAMESMLKGARLLESEQGAAAGED
jgi:hypothetical protein